MKRVILADDHTVVREAIRGLLEISQDFKVVGHAKDGESLIDLASRVECDVIILDISMPTLNGIEATKILRERNVNSPILALSANDTVNKISRVLEAGANGFVPKNSSFEELSFAINSIIKGNQYLSPSVTQKIMNAKEESGKDGALSSLTKRELEIFKLLAEGKPNREIGKFLNISIRTVDTHRSNILKKLNLKNNAELVRLAFAEGLLSVSDH